MTGGTPLFDQEGNRKYLNAAERLRFFQAVNRLECTRDKSFCLTLYHMGCRISEALEVTRNRVDLEDKIMILRTLKQRKHQRYLDLSIPDDLLGAVKNQLRHTNTNRLWDFSRTTGWRVVKRVMTQADLEGIKATPKGLRHSYAIACISASVSLPKLRKWMGHEDINTTTIYLDFVGEDDRELTRKVWGLYDR